MGKKKLHVVIAYNEPQHKNKNDLDFISEAAVKEEADTVYQVILKMGHVPHFLPVKTLSQAVQQVEELCPDIIFNLCEGFQGNAKHEMHLSGVWELLQIPYTGNPPITLGLAQDKVLAKKLFQTEKIPTPAFEVFETTPEKTSLEFPLIAKPSREDASLGIKHNSLIDNFEKLRFQVDDLLLKYRQPILVEKFIPGREFNISILGAEPPRVLPISEISFAGLEPDVPHITSYEAKWLPEHPLYQKTPAICPAKLDSQLKQRLEATALRVYHILGGRDYGRVDIRVDDGENIFVLEFNPNPDISPDAGYAKALKAAGILYRDFIEIILNHTLARKKV